MKKTGFLVSMFLLLGYGIQAQVFTFNLGSSPGTSTPEGFFTHDTNGSWNFNKKYNGCEYDGMTFDHGLKMEGSTKILFTTTQVSTVTIVQSTLYPGTIKLDETELAKEDAAEGTGCRIYTLTDVAAAEHTITRGVSESGLFFIKVEYASSETPQDYSVSFKTDGGWEDVYAYTWKDDIKALGEWPGTKMTAEGDVYTIAFTSTQYPYRIVFHDNHGNKTPEYVFEDGKTYEYMMLNMNVSFRTNTGWADVYAYAFDKDGDDVTEYLGEWPGTKMSDTDPYSIAFKAFTEPTYIVFNDGADAKSADYDFYNGKNYRYMVAVTQPLYALKEGDSFRSGEKVAVTDNGETVAYITYGVEGGMDFTAAIAATNEDNNAYTAYTTGNGENGSSSSGTCYFIEPLFDGTVTVAVSLKAGKKFYIEEDGQPLPQYDGIQNDYPENGCYSFPVTAEKTYTLYAVGTKLGFFGFDYAYEKAEVYEITVEIQGDVPSEAVTIHGTGQYKEGETAHLSFELADEEHYGFDYWQWDDRFSKNENLALEVTGNTTVNLYFKTTSYMVTVTAEPAEGGEVTGSGLAPYKSVVVLTATANEGYRFAGWKDDASATETRMVEVSGDATYTALFEPETVTAIETPDNEGGMQRRKVVENGTVYILAPNGQRFTPDGRESK